MAKYSIALTAMAHVSCCVQVEAEDIEKARQKACDEAMRGNVTWSYDGVDDETIDLGDE